MRRGEAATLCVRKQSPGREMPRRGHQRRDEEPPPSPAGQPSSAAATKIAEPDRDPAIFGSDGPSPRQRAGERTEAQGTPGREPPAANATGAHSTPTVRRPPASSHLRPGPTRLPPRGLPPTGKVPAREPLPPGVVALMAPTR